MKAPSAKDSSIPLVQDPYYNSYAATMILPIFQFFKACKGLMVSQKKKCQKKNLNFNFFEQDARKREEVTLGLILV